MEALNRRQLVEGPIRSSASDNYLQGLMCKLVRSCEKGNYPPGGQATPITYRLSANRRQSVVIAAGGHHLLPSTTRDSLIAFALPK
jgi:quinoprotein glucose dehydrogenase